MSKLFLNALKARIKIWLTFNEVNALFRMPFVAGGVLTIKIQKILILRSPL